MPYYQPDVWDRLKETVADPEYVEASHGEWLAKLRRCEADMKRIGVLVKTVDVDPDELARFCAAQAIPNTRESRTRYAAELLRQRQLAEAESDDDDDYDD